MVPDSGTIRRMNTKHRKTLDMVFAMPVSSSIRWKDIESLFVALGADVNERAGSRVAVVLCGQIYVFHRPHPRPDTDKGAVVSVRKWLERLGVTPETIDVWLQERSTHDDQFDDD